MIIYIYYNLIIYLYLNLLFYINIFKKIYQFTIFMYNIIKLIIYQIFTHKYNFNNYVDHNIVLNINKYYKLK